MILVLDLSYFQFLVDFCFPFFFFCLWGLLLFLVDIIDLYSSPSYSPHLCLFHPIMIYRLTHHPAKPFHPSRLLSPLLDLDVVPPSHTHPYPSVSCFTMQHDPLTTAISFIRTIVGCLRPKEMYLTLSLEVLFAFCRVIGEW